MHAVGKAHQAMLSQWFTTELKPRSSHHDKKPRTGAGIIPDKLPAEKIIANKTLGGSNMNLTYRFTSLVANPDTIDSP